MSPPVVLITPWYTTPSGDMYLIKLFITVPAMLIRKVLTPSSATVVAPAAPPDAPKWHTRAPIGAAKKANS